MGKKETTEATEKFAKNPNRFKRGKQLGFAVIELEIGQTRFLNVLAVDVMNSKKHGEIDFANVVDLETGEEGRLWIGGQIKHLLSQVTLPQKLEVTRKPKVKAMVEIEGKQTEKEVNQYDVFLLED